MESFHPLIVHFPIALLLTALALEVAALFLKREDLRRASLWNLTLGTVGAAVAVATGLHAESVARHSFEIWQIMELHERLGITTLILGLTATTLRWSRRDRLTPRARVLALALMSLMAATISFGAYLGGRMVYEFGVGQHRNTE